MTNDEIDALIFPVLAQTLSGTADQHRAIFRAGLREAAGMLTNEIDKYPRMNDLPCVRKMQEIARAIFRAGLREAARIADKANEEEGYSLPFIAGDAIRAATRDET